MSKRFPSHHGVLWCQKLESIHSFQAPKHFESMLSCKIAFPHHGLHHEHLRGAGLLLGAE